VGVAVYKHAFFITVFVFAMMLIDFLDAPPNEA
jgi:hypothetical protein